jgi:hypothetical protein
LHIKFIAYTKKLTQDISQQKKTLIVDEEGQVVEICKKHVTWWKHQETHENLFEKKLQNLAIHVCS